MKKALITIPTYNEAENIVNIINELLALKLPDIEIDVLVIDDNSSDGTSNLVKAIASNRVHVIDRAAKMGLGTAYIIGIQVCYRK